MPVPLILENLAAALRQTARSVKPYGDNALLVNLSLDELIVLYFIDADLSLAAIKKAINQNTRADIHTLIILGEGLLPAEGAAHQPNDALQLLLDVYWGRVYGYRLVDDDPLIFPVFIERTTSYGEPVDLSRLGCDYVLVASRHMRGVRQVADFERRPFNAPVPLRDPLDRFYAFLGIRRGASVDEIKRAYREKAQRYHPDRNLSPDATAQMQLINLAYTRIMAHKNR